MPRAVKKPAPEVEVAQVGIDGDVCEQCWPLGPPEEYTSGGCEHDLNWSRTE